MNISSITASSNSVYTTNQDEISQLQKQRTKLQKELQEVNQSNENAKVKEQKAKAIQIQIQQIDAQIQQKRAEKNDQSENATKPMPANNTLNVSTDSRDLLNKDTSNNKIDIKI